MPKRKTKSAKSSSPEHVKTREGNIRNPATGFGGSRGTTFAGNWLRLAEAVGGVNALAAALGTSYPTLYRWAVKGDVVPPMARQMLGIIAAQKNLPNPSITET